MNKQTLVTILAIVAVAGLVAVVGYALITSNSIPVTVNPTVGIILGVDATTTTNGDLLHIIATLSAGVPDQTVTFLRDGSTIGSTFSSGRIATYDYTTVNEGDTPIIMTFTATIP